MITEEFLRIFECIHTFSAMGALQARVEISALQYALEDYTTDKSRLVWRALKYIIVVILTNVNNRLFSVFQNLDSLVVGVF